MKPKLITIQASINTKRLLIQGKNLSFEIPQKNFAKIHAPLWTALAIQAKKNEGKKFFSFELDKEESRHLYSLGKKLEQKEQAKKPIEVKQKQLKPSNYKKAPSNLRAISIHAPFAYAICMGLKDEEYRTLPTNIREWVLIHASLSKDSDEAFKDYGIDPKKIVRGAIIGAAEIVDCQGSDRDYAYLIGEYKLFEKPLKISGKQVIFWKAKNPTEQRIFDEAWSMID